MKHYFIARAKYEFTPQVTSGLEGKGQKNKIKIKKVKEGRLCKRRWTKPHERGLVLDRHGFYYFLHVPHYQILFLGVDYVHKQKSVF